MRPLVTGAAGVIGSRLCHRLVAEGHDVVGFDDLSEGRLDNLSDSREVAFVEADLRDHQAVARAASGRDVIFHRAAKRSVPRSLLEPLLTTDVNVRGTLNVLEAARASGARVVYASSSSVYGDQETLPLHEGMLPGPKSPYAATKLADEALAIAYHHSLHLPSVGLRSFNVGGGGEPTSVSGLLAIVAELTGATPDPIHEPAREGDMRATQADLTQVKAALGLEPSVDIREGLRRTVEWFSKETA